MKASFVLIRSAGPLRIRVSHHTTHPDPTSQSHVRRPHRGRPRGEVASGVRAVPDQVIQIGDIAMEWLDRTDWVVGA